MHDILQSQAAQPLDGEETILFLLHLKGCPVVSRFQIFQYVVEETALEGIERNSNRFSEGPLCSFLLVCFE